MTILPDKILGVFAGLEFKEDSLVVSFVKNGISGMRLLSSSTFPLKTDEATFTAIREYINRQGAKPDRVFVCIPDKWVITKFTEIPPVKGKGKEALINLLQFEIEKHIPYNLEEVSFDFLLLDKKASAYLVVFAAVHKDRITYVRDYLEKLSLQPDAVMPSSFAVLNTIELSGLPAGGLRETIGIVRKSRVIRKNGETNISLYFDGGNAYMSLLKDGVYMYHRSFPFKIKQELGTFLNDIARYLTEIQSRFSVERFNTLILSGDLSAVENIVHELKEKTGVNIVTLDRLSGFSRGVENADINISAPSVGACFAGLGMATYAVNLLPHKIEYRTRGTVPVSTRILLVLILILAAGIVAVGAVKRKQYITTIEAELKKNTPVIDEIEKLSAESDVLRERINVLHELKNNDILLEILTELSGLLPDDAWMSNFEYRVYDIKDPKKGVGEIILSGYAASSSALVPLLEDSPYLEKVSFVGPVKKTGDKEQFKLSARLVLPEEKGPADTGEGLKEKNKTGE